MKRNFDWRMMWHPRTWVVLLCIVVSIFLLVYSLGTRAPLMPIVYASYVFSTYTLVITILAIPHAYRWLKVRYLQSRFYRWLTKTLRKNRFTRLLLEDTDFRVVFTLVCSTLANAIFILWNFWNGVTNRSSWFITLSIYYALLVVTKVFLIITARRELSKKRQYELYATVGGGLLLLNAILGVMLVVMVRDHIGTPMNSNLIYANALYAFWLIILAAMNAYRFRHYHNPLISAVKIINLFAAMVSILMLQTTMIATYGGDDLSFLRLMTELTGGIILLIVLCISVAMILYAGLQIRRET